MSKTADASGSANADDELTEDERQSFERLREEYEDGDINQICQAVLQSEESEEARS